MTACPACGADNSATARFCSSCGSPLRAPERPPEARKVVTVVFCDVTGSTSLGEQLDAEVLRRVMSRYFDEMRAAVDRHGGVVEKFIGDAVMAVFGIPQLHEDDALRAVRAAVEMRDALRALNDELGAQLQARTGVNTGEVVAGDPSTGQLLVTGDAVNVAARLEQAAAPGQILLGALTYELVCEAVRAQPVEPLQVKGKTERIDAYLLTSVDADSTAISRRLHGALVGRERELRAVRAELDRTVEEESCRLLLVLGQAGIGKSRLVRELVARTERARVVTGRCLPYGKGITFWPLVEIVRQLGGGDARTTAHELVRGDEHAVSIAERIAAATGQAERPVSTEETFWAIRKVFEALARDGPLVAVVDDLQWAEPTFLDLVEYLVAFTSGVPILIVGVARPELMETRPAWTAPRPKVTTLLLEPLSEHDANELVERLPHADELAPGIRERILTIAEGNPLFVEQMLALQADRGDGGADVPPTIQALLAARIDQLEPDERSVIERASVEGRLFHRGAVAELSPERIRPAVAAHLLALVRKELVRPDRALFAGDDGFRFGHILIRDAAYAALPKADRAEVHERYADWLERKAGRSDEYAEIVGYHLEQAHRYALELGARDVSLHRLGSRAGLVLGTAGQRALARSDVHAATNLLDRALSLLPEDDPGHLEFRFALGDALVEGAELERGAAILDELADDAGGTGDVRTGWHARLRAAWARLLRLELTVSRAGAIAREAVAVLHGTGDDIGLALAWQLAAQARNFDGDVAGLADAMQKAYEHARRAGAQRLATQSAFWLGLSTFYGPTPRADAIATCRHLLDSATTPVQQADARFWLGAVNALGGERSGLDEARDARRMYAELGVENIYGGSAVPTGYAEQLVGEVASAEHTLREADSILAKTGEKGFRSTVLLELADVLCARARFDEAEQTLAKGTELGSSDDVFNKGLSAMVRSKLAFAREAVEDAERFAAAAVAAFEAEQLPCWRADSLLVFASVLRATGRVDEARAAVEDALDLYRRKGVPRSAARATALLESLSPA